MLGLALASALLLVVSACAVVFPELSTPVRQPPPGQRFEPEPPEDLLFVTFQGAEIPDRTRDGRQWDSVGGDAPDPFAKLVVDDQDVLVTPVQANTLTPTWPDQPKENYRIGLRSSVRVELWDSNPINNSPICVKKVPNLHAETRAGIVEISCDSGARLMLRVEPARAKLGLGLQYELQNESIVITRVAPESPAARVGLRSGDEIVEIQGKAVEGLEDGQAQSLINANSRAGLHFKIKRGGKLQALTLKEGPIYATAADDGGTGP